MGDTSTYVSTVEKSQRLDFLQMGGLFAVPGSQKGCLRSGIRGFAWKQKWSGWRESNPYWTFPAQSVYPCSDRSSLSPLFHGGIAVLSTVHHGAPSYHSIPGANCNATFAQRCPICSSCRGFWSAAPTCELDIITLPIRAARGTEAARRRDGQWL